MFITWYRLLNDARGGDDDLLFWTARVGAYRLDFLDDICAFFDFAKDDVFAIQPWCHHRGNEELQKAIGQYTVTEAQRASGEPVSRLCACRHLPWREGKACHGEA